MATTFSVSAFGPHSAAFGDLKKAVLEPALIAGAAIFWVAALPFVAFSLVFVKVWDALTALEHKLAGVRQHPLFLRR